MRNLFPDQGKPHFPKRQFVRNPEEADAVAAKLCQSWSLGMDALESVTQCLENHGALIVHYNEEATNGFDGLSATINGRHPLLIVNNEVEKIGSSLLGLVIQSIFRLEISTHYCKT